MNQRLKSALTAIVHTLVDQRRARIVIEPQRRAPGFWFGGGNVVQLPDGRLALVGRYRNQGDSRTGLHAGERGLELALFVSNDHGQSFEKALSFSKEQLNVEDRRVLSIEGSALAITDEGFELFVSTEKSGIGYPPPWESYLKPGTGVWTIERLAARTLGGLSHSRPETIVECRDPRFIHAKDPAVYRRDDDMILLFCTHPFCWTSSNTAYAIRPHGESAFGPPVIDFFPRGMAWDVAITRGTSIVDLPRVGIAAESPVSLLFYDGGECVRNLDEHRAAVSRPRGYSCEELGGAAVLFDQQLSRPVRLSDLEPLLVSPHGTGCSRYVDVLVTESDYYVTWQQAQGDGSQPLVMNVVPREEIERLLE